MRKLSVAAMVTMMMVVQVAGQAVAIGPKAGPGRAGGRAGGPAAKSGGNVGPGAGNLRENGGPGLQGPGNLGQQGPGPGNLSLDALRDKARNGNPQGGSLPDRASQAQSQWQGRAQNLANYAPQSQPFTAAWYLDHPSAWQATHPHADAWAVATFGAAAAWVGLAATQPAVYQSYESYTVSEGSASQPSDEEQVSQAGGLAASGNVNLKTSEWLPLGVYGLLPGDFASGEKAAANLEANLLVQLVADKSGALTGAYYDVLSDKGQTIQGSIDKADQRVAWSVAGSKAALFETSLGNLTKDRSPLLVHFPNGRTQKWTLVRLEAPAKGK